MDRHPGIVAATTRRAAWAASALLLLAACGEGEGAHESVGADARSAAEAPADFDSIEIEVTGDDYRWHVTYPGPDGELGTADDVVGERDVHVPAGTPTVLRLHSRDYVYKLRLPDFGKAEIAVPRQEFTLAFDSGAPGTHELRGDQFCGFSHPDLIGTLHVRPAREFAEWMQERPTVEPDRDGTQ